MSLRSDLIRLAHERKELRATILPILVRTAKERYYHASPKRFKKGDILVPGLGGGYSDVGSGVGAGGIFMTNSPVPHGTIASSIPGWWGSNFAEKGSYEQRLLEWENASEEERRQRLFKKPSMDPWTVYEVKPLGPVKYFHGEKELVAHRAEVIAIIGDAATILQRELKPKKGVYYGWDDQQGKVVPMTYPKQPRTNKVEVSPPGSRRKMEERKLERERRHLQRREVDE